MIIYQSTGKFYYKWFAVSLWTQFIMDCFFFLHVLVSDTCESSSVGVQCCCGPSRGWCGHLFTSYPVPPTILHFLSSTWRKVPSTSGGFFFLNLSVFYISYYCCTKTISLCQCSNCHICPMKLIYISHHACSIKMLHAIERTCSCGLPQWTRSSQLFLLALGCLFCLRPPAGKLRSLI